MGHIDKRSPADVVLARSPAPGAMIWDAVG
jgi:hypothetical protein